MMPIFASERGTICLWKYAYGVDMVEEPPSGRFEGRYGLEIIGRAYRRGQARYDEGCYIRTCPADSQRTLRSEMDLGLRDKVAVITGGSRGIGRAIGLGLAAEGCNVAFCARGEGGPRGAGPGVGARRAGGRGGRGGGGGACAGGGGGGRRPAGRRGRGRGGGGTGGVGPAHA